jgi:lipoate-protein ligase A
MKDWRLIYSSPASGAENMAVDEAILQAVCDQKSPCTLRVYAWQPPCLSMGFAQPSADVDNTRLQDLEWDIVRRPTGGRAILHTDELTYALIAPDNHPDFSGGVLISYQKISKALVRTLEIVGLDVTVSSDQSLPEEERQEPVCFQTPSAYEISVQGKKIVGSAQLRRRGAVLQHGTIPLHGDIARICQVLKYENEAAREAAIRRVRTQSATIEDVLQKETSWDFVVKTFVRSFEEVLGWQFSTGDLSTRERDLCQSLIESRYAAVEWTQRI